MIAPTPEVFPGGSTEEPWSSTDGDPSLEIEYEAGGAYAATDGEGRIEISVDGEARGPIEVVPPGASGARSARANRAPPAAPAALPGLLVYSLQFAAGVPG